MDRHPHLCPSPLACLAACAFLAVRPARADQIVLLTDERGHKIFINTGEAPKPLWSATFDSKRRDTQKSPTPEINSLVQKISGRFAVDPQLVHAIIEVESEYNPKAVSRKGALGLMQLLPSTALRLGVRDPFDPRQNIEGGVTHLRTLLDRFGGDVPLSLAAYNSGTHSVERFGGIPSFSETKDYVRRVWKLYQPGSTLAISKLGRKAPVEPGIFQYVDSQGVLHFTNVQ